MKKFPVKPKAGTAFVLTYQLRTQACLSGPPAGPASPRRVEAGEAGRKSEEVIGNEMILLVQATVLTVGIDGRREVLQELPIRLISVQSGIEAVSSFKNESIDSVISKWDLIDMPDGTFLKRLRGIRPNIPTIAVIKTDNYAQEISARSLGVSAVLTESSSDEHFREVVRQVLGLKDVASIRGIRALKETTEREKT